MADYFSFRMALAIFLCAGCISYSSGLSAQFAPAAGLPGSTAIAASADSIVMWATGCTVKRGLQDIAVSSSGYASAGDSAQAIGPAGGNTIVSLGDGGTATLTFEHAITDRPGFDFAVFENGFNAGGPQMAFLELGFVEVSSDGQRFVRFPATDDTQDTVQLVNGSTMDASQLNNLAGKYVSGFGTPFDLEELRDSAGIDIQHITHVRIQDVIGSLSDIYATHDSRGHKINDPYPTPFASGGFDLDAVGVMHAEGVNGVPETRETSLYVFPNPAINTIYIHPHTSDAGTITFNDINGGRVLSRSFAGEAAIDIAALAPGTYIATISFGSGSFYQLVTKL